MMADPEYEQIQVEVDGVDVFDPSSGEVRSDGRIAVKVINHLGDEVMKVFRVD